jgi:transcriptional regulator with XRE-family HTH domain
MGMTQEQLAEVMCIPKSTISAYENDKVDIKGSVLVELSEHLYTTPNYLLGIEDYKGSFTLNALALLKKVDDIKMQTAVLVMLKSWLEA